MNKNDSERIIGLLFGLGLKRVEKPELADLIIINTCSVRQVAEERVLGLLHNWQSLRSSKPNLIIAITGCMPGRDHDGKIKKRLKGVDLFFAIESLPMLPQWLNELGLECDFGGYKFEDGPDYFNINPSRDNTTSVFVSIQTGCNNFCTYCVVPYARGREKNRPVKEILAEIKSVVEAGAKEINLLGQVVNHYIAPDKKSFSNDNPFLEDDFAALLWEINQIPGEFRIHYTAPDPQYFSNAQIEALKLPKQVNYLHLPVQSGDNEILRKMNRKYTRENYIQLIKKIKIASKTILYYIT